MGGRARATAEAYRHASMRLYSRYSWGVGCVNNCEECVREGGRQLCVCARKSDGTRMGTGGSRGTSRITTLFAHICVSTALACVSTGLPPESLTTIRASRTVSSRCAAAQDAGHNRPASLVNCREGGIQGGGEEAERKLEGTCCEGCSGFASG